MIGYDDDDDDDDNDDNDDINSRRFKFKTDDNLLYNKKNNIPVCVISICSVIKKENIHYPIFRLQKCFYENESFIKNINFFVYKYKRWIILLIIKRIEISY